MKKIHLIIAALFICIIFPSKPLSAAENKHFDFILVLTKQDRELNWWSFVPADYAPHLSPISEVVKGEYFMILPIFSNYGITKENRVNITYDLEILKPDGSTYDSKKAIPGHQGQIQAPYLLPAQGLLMVCFEPEDHYGEYIINITAHDHIKNKKVKKKDKITLIKFTLNKFDGDFNDWFFTYPAQPKPTLALSSFVSPTHAYLDEKGEPLWASLWFYKNIYLQNDFLYPHTVDFYKTKANKQQQKDIILLFSLLDKTNALPINEEFDDYLIDLKKIAIPDPYNEIKSGEQLDMLWAEFFATSRIKPVRQILTALDLSVYIGTIDKVKAGELASEPDKSDEVNNMVMLEAVFQSVLWSITSNCRKSPLLFQYCVGLHKSVELNDTEKKYLGFILKQVAEEKQNAN